MDEINKLKEGVKSANELTFSSLVLSILKLVVGLTTNSVVLISDALHSGSDLITALVSLIGLKIAQKKENERFPYGYYKAENLSALLVSALITVGAIGLIREGVERLNEPSLTKMPILAMATALTAVIVSYIISKRTIKVGEKINSQSLIANGKERLLDVISASLVFVSIALSSLGIKYIEGITTIIISLFILKVGIETGKESILALMDYNPKENKEILNYLNKKAGGEIKFTNIKIRKAGPFLLGEVEAEAKENTNIKKAYEIIETAKRQAMKQFDITQLEVTIKPKTKKTIKIVIPTTNGKVSDHFARAQEFEIVKIDVKNRKILNKKRIKNPYFNKQVRAGLSAAKFLLKQNIDYIITKEIGEISLHTLSDNAVAVIKAKDENIEKTIKDFLNERLKLIKHATKIKE